jgi:hypothetical protein
LQPVDSTKSIASFIIIAVPTMGTMRIAPRATAFTPTFRSSAAGNGFAPPNRLDGLLIKSRMIE